MTAPDPTCTVKDGSGSPQATIDGVDVTPANTITIALSSVAGVSSWDLDIYGLDDAVSSPTVTVNSTTKTATFTAPAAPFAILFKSTVNNGVDVNGITQSTYSTTFGVYARTVANSLRLGAINETLEGDSNYGWVTKLNDIVRLVG